MNNPDFKGLKFSLSETPIYKIQYSLINTGTSQ